MASNSSARRKNAGFAVLLTGLPAAGKTTLGRALTTRIESEFSRPVSLLDGDEVRKLMSSELGFSREHRRLNVLRHGYFASEICRHGGIAVSALIAPYAADRADMRQLVARHGSFIEVYLSTPLSVCESRDPKGLYAKARAGTLHHMTGVDDPYEAPARPDIKLDGAQLTVDGLVDAIVGFLLRKGLLAKRAIKRSRAQSARGKHRKR